MNDLMLARTNQPGLMNLAIGEPVVVQDAFSEVFSGEQSWSADNPPWTMRYPSLGGEKDLLEELKILYPGKHIVVTNGAKQGLAGAFLSMKAFLDKKSIFASAPYWVSFPTLAASVGMTFKTSPSSSGIECITSPNNPDGEQIDWPEELHDHGYGVWDSVYAHPLYGWNRREPKAIVTVGAASKMFGVTGYRVGWAVTEQEPIAQFIAKYVEESTSGVATPSQAQVAYLLRLKRTANDAYVEASIKARNNMLKNARVFSQVLGGYCDAIQGTPFNDVGMFAWFKVRGGFDGEGHFQGALNKAKVLVLPGRACGMQEPGWFRMNMAHRTDYTEKALITLEANLHA